MKRTETIRVAVVNHATEITDQDVAAGVAAMQKQVSEDFAPIWTIDAALRFVGRDEHRSSLPDHWGLILADDAAQAEQLGYHDLTASGLPLAVIEVGRIPRGHDWTHTASHELLEMLADPTADIAVYSRPDEDTQRVYAREVCDPCAAYEDGYVIEGRRVTDFVFPSWFHGLPRHHARPDANGRHDERGLIKTPLEIRPGGFIGVLDPGTFTWSLVGSDGQGQTAEDVSRMQRRASSRTNWQLSDMSWVP
jgi:hypothetical protein